MCGILGVSLKIEDSLEKDSDSRLDAKNRLETALKALSHRGPDGYGSKIFFASGVFLGHTRLAIQDLSPAGHQPMMSLDEKYALTYNGEIYNFPVLKEKLESLGYNFSSNTDTEVILNLYQEYGLDCFAMLDGIFALGIFDKEKNQLIISRDGLGIKPLYYYQDDSRLVFASEIKAIEIFLQDVVLTLQKSNINKYLTFQWCPGEGTPFTEIKNIFQAKLQ